MNPGDWSPVNLIAGNVRVVRCLCGDDIAAIDDHDGRAIAVRAHQQTPKHQAWRARTPAFDGPPHPKLLPGSQ